MIILTGASASGKTEVCKSLCFRYGYKKFVTTTTRAPRVGEIDGVDYYFISKEEFLKKIDNNEFIEHVCYNGNYYGTEKIHIEQNAVLVVEPNGLKAFRALNDSSIVSFVLESSQETRKRRMILRGDDIEAINYRLIIDENNFSKEKVIDADYFVDSEKVTILKLAEQINDLYNKKRKDD